MSKVIVHKKAAGYLKGLPRPRREQAKTALSQLGDNPLEFPGIKQMVGEWAGYHRIRIG